MPAGHTQTQQGEVSPALFSQLQEKDSLSFADVLCSCDIQQLSSLLSKDFLFYQDNGGPTYAAIADRSKYLDGSKGYCARNNQGPEKKIRRVVPGTLQVYLLGDYGAIQMGVQRFYVTKTGIPDQLVEVSKFTNTWQLKDGQWKLSKLFVSLEEGHSPHTDPLYDTIARLDAKLFRALNNRDLDSLMSMYDGSLEFYHDKSGLMDYATSKAINKRNFSDTSAHQTVRRELDQRSLRVYPIPGYGAMEIGLHRFYTKPDGQAEQLTASPEFLLIWQNKNGTWKVTRAISWGH
ncbi:MAG TPA: nuclear transport factor 2 family protein [Mucilaginibacter sp.]|jgi:ketosteroid isomerase-like protein|nr:nuclear transport factor 2 family protein [Mucilaginibacter sp.]